MLGYLMIKQMEQELWEYYTSPLTKYKGNNMFKVHDEVWTIHDRIAQQMFIGQIIIKGWISSNNTKEQSIKYVLSECQSLDYMDDDNKDNTRRENQIFASKEQLIQSL